MKTEPGMTKTMTRVSNRVSLSGVTEGSSNDACSPTGSGRAVRLDENPQMKTLTGEDENPVLVGSYDVSKEGPCHQAGVGAPHQQINTRASVLCDRDYEAGPDDAILPDGWKTEECIA